MTPRQMNDVFKKAVLRSLLVAVADKIRSVVQVGACDGIEFDFYYPLWNIFNWPTTFVEPHPVLFQKLRQTYAHGENCTFVDAALDLTSGTRTLYQNLESGYGNSSFYPEVCPNGLPMEVNTVTWDSVLTESTDLVILDCEGHDEVLLRDLLVRAAPKIIIWERTRVLDFSELMKFINSKGYKSIPGDVDGLNYISIWQPSTSKE